MNDEEKQIRDLYAVYVQTITANEQRRLQISVFYLSLVATGVAAIGAIDELDPLFIAFPAFVVSGVWFSTIRYFRRLAKAKFAVVEAMENDFPIHPFGLEWKYYKKNHASAESGKWYQRVRFGLTHLDMSVPLLILFVSGSYLIFRIISLLCGG